VTPSHASALCKEGGEALTGGVQAGLWSSEINRPRVADLVTRWGRPHEASRKREWRLGPAESKNQGMYTSCLHGNREIPEAVERIPRSARSVKAKAAIPT
jgi:hypothetical protein